MRSISNLLWPVHPVPLWKQSGRRDERESEWAARKNEPLGENEIASAWVGIKLLHRVDLHTRELSIHDYVHAAAAAAALFSVYNHHHSWAQSARRLLIHNADIREQRALESGVSQKAATQTVRAANQHRFDRLNWTLLKAGRWRRTSFLAPFDSASDRQAGAFVSTRLMRFDRCWCHSRKNSH